MQPHAVQALAWERWLCHSLGARCSVLSRTVDAHSGVLSDPPAPQRISWKAAAWLAAQGCVHLARAQVPDAAVVGERGPSWEQSIFNPAGLAWKRWPHPRPNEGAQTYISGAPPGGWSGAVGPESEQTVPLKSVLLCLVGRGGAEEG